MLLYVRRGPTLSPGSVGPKLTAEIHQVRGDSTNSSTLHGHKVPGASQFEIAVSSRPDNQCRRPCTAQVHWCEVESQFLFDLDCLLNASSTQLLEACKPPKIEAGCAKRKHSHAVDLRVYPHMPASTLYDMPWELDGVTCGGMSVSRTFRNRLVSSDKI